MLIRALIVLLAVLNLGVAAWWMTRPEAEPPPVPEVPLGVSKLELVNAPAAQPSAAVAVSAVPAAPAANAPTPAPAPASAAASACFRLGPFADRAGAEQSRARLSTVATRTTLRELPAAGASGYRVLLPPAASREQAQVTAQRIGAAGFDDFLVINNGDEANSVALGRYRSREAALRRQTQLVAAGFPAEIRTVGREAPAQWWIGATVPAATSAAALRQQAGADRAEPQDCAALR